MWIGYITIYQRWRHIVATHKMTYANHDRCCPCSWSVWMVPGTFDQNGEPVTL